MNAKRLIILGITFLVILVGVILLISLFSPAKSGIRCHDNCIKDGWQDGQCEWPSLMNETDWNFKFQIQDKKSNLTFPYVEIENRGSCVEAFLGTKSRHCGNEGQCNCYCFNYKKG
jgi:hypothetical protein